MDECIKTKFGSKKFADEAIARIQEKSTRDKVPMRSYLCPKCGTWHLTSKSKSYDDMKSEIEFVNSRYDETVKLLEEITGMNMEGITTSFVTELKNRRSEVKDLQTKLFQQKEVLRKCKEERAKQETINRNLSDKIKKLKNQLENQQNQITNLKKNQK